MSFVQQGYAARLACTLLDLPRCQLYRTAAAPPADEDDLRGAVQRLAGEAEGFLYYVSMTGVTGTQKVDAAAIAASVAEVRRHSRVPVAVGFGVSSPEDAQAVGVVPDAAPHLVHLLQRQLECGRTLRPLGRTCCGCSIRRRCV